MNTNGKNVDHSDEARIDETIEASFPASDPPSWTLGCDRRIVVPAQPQPEEHRSGISRP
ncbi:MAG: hypothetical protein M3O46_08925 [Myxococcota bacterium]|nr:hypothetical protein [Myxococcota bacterium]